MAAFPMGARLYVIDTSSIIEPRRLLSQEKPAVRDRLYNALGELVNDGALRFPTQVYEELDRYHDDSDKADRPWEWARDHKDNAMGDVTLDQLFESVRAVQEVVDNLVDFDKPSPGG